MHADIEKAIELIDEKIKELRQAKHALFNAFGNSQQQPVTAEERPTLTVTRTFGRMNAAPGSRKGEVVKLLKDRGPLTRSEIRDGVSFPEGTISYVLTDATLFANKDGKWYLKEQMEKQGGDIEDVKS